MAPSCFASPAATGPATPDAAAQDTPAQDKAAGEDDAVAASDAPAPSDDSDRPATDELRMYGDMLALAYKERPVTLIRMIYALRDSRIQTFADAFKLRRG